MTVLCCGRIRRMATGDSPDTTGKDRTLGLAKAALSAVPVLGGPAAELLDLVVRPEIERRRTEWLDQLAEQLAAIEERLEGFHVSALANDPEFISTLLQASAAALREHEAEKLEALRNAVLNAALEAGPTEDERALFISWVDQLTPWHLRLLRFLDDKEGVAHARDKLPFPNWVSGGVSTVLELVYPELVGRRAFYDLLVTDLKSRGLIVISSLHVTGTVDGYMLARQTSDLGQRFLSFVTTPPILAKET